MIEQVLAIETSCDDTSVAVVRRDGFVLSLVSASQDLAHEPFGGIVPEIACRNHSIALLPLVEEALKKAAVAWTDLGGMVVTNRPGLIGSLIVGVITAKSLAQARHLPLIGVNHLEGHLLAPFLRDDGFAPPPDFAAPYVGLAISGGHTSLYRINGLGDYEVLGATKDDAAGEAFDKFAKMIGLGFPGGVKVDRLARNGDPKAFNLPRSLLHEDTFDMSFSGLKSSAQRLVDQLGPEETARRQADLCASFQEAAVDVLVAKLDKAVRRTGLRRAILTGGVSANSRLRERTQAWADRENIQLVIPPIRYCTDNAAMIGYAGILRLNRGERHGLDLSPSPQSAAGDFREGRA
ncbi:MAG: tRNA (adenosine(37)-N6)-threonylcarbamoyltransferase complex transferase subunit TsaD [Bdellovibrionaceae bacterium]|nr:tRNA (adenosine(37)-N6)-threonylcarbamoyltransferase complex transferase subunit TsaD [Pseudobdellovibrionaceae bacterium]MBX3032854.1 tRNA (adenosine(37)-N6)-threonylcarbamoyltransferase complex transferase subunit TsaD [Pseudobdellovibrionaceae bacterium]